MDHIKIENTWESYYIAKECECNYNGSWLDSNGAKFFINNNLYAVKYPNLIITKTADCHNHQIKHLHIFDTNQNKIIFSSENILSEENQEYIKRTHRVYKHSISYGTFIDEFNKAKFLYGDTIMMENFMIMKVRSSLWNQTTVVGYVIFNFKTQTYKSFMFCSLYIFNDKSVFVFVEKGEDGKITKIKIITKSDMDNNINNIMEIDFCKTIEGYGKDGIDMCCMCNSSIIIFRLGGKYIYCDIKKQKNVYTSKNQFIGWRGNKFIEYDEELKKCNLISFISDDIQQIPVKNNTPKKIINCIRCLDKFEEYDEETIPEHKNVCSLCIIKL